MTLIGIYGFKKDTTSNPTHPMISAPDTTLIKFYTPNDKHITNSTIQVYVDTPNEQPRNKSLSREIRCEVVLPLNKKYTMKQNLDLFLKYVCINPNAEYEIKLVGNYVHDHLHSK